MILRHTGLACSSEEKSDRFYSGLLGLQKAEPKTIPLELSQAIFNVASELRVINYTDENLQFEVFIVSPCSDYVSRIGHVCIEVENLESFLGRCRSMDVEARRIPKGDSLITFVEDFDGNLFEIKQRSNAPAAPP